MKYIKVTHQTKRNLFFIISLLIVACTNTQKMKENSAGEKILLEQFDSKGRISKKIVSGRIPGEDIYLTIIKYDSIGNIIEKYGAEPYDHKFRTKFMYNSHNLLIEKWHYSFFSGNNFENYSDKAFYELSDTVADFSGFISSKTILTYNFRDSIKIQSFYKSILDSSTNKRYFELAQVDTMRIDETDNR